MAASVRMPDFFIFDVGEAMLTLDQAPDGRARFPVDARIDGRTFVKCHVDLGIATAVNAGAFRSDRSLEPAGLEKCSQQNLKSP